ncbi:hypothetical protein F4821DRAFT_250270 [Hypoxylon rubiginosum]|uniref:Uncharacterized protein n=1 Tax=Hypoxylon rubiginosum TaxID=110542 RepID=A0ACC0CKV1_9PEZI|nr:hypothetical protein F4821DRAFT_250270 [Hypoxylon rubiginosum]
MPQNPSTSGRKTKSRRRNKPTKNHDSKKAHHGSPTPQSQGTSDPNGGSTGAYDDQHNTDQYLLGMGAQFNDSK